MARNRRVHWKRLGSRNAVFQNGLPRAAAADAWVQHSWGPSDASELGWPRQKRRCHGCDQRQTAPVEVAAVDAQEGHVLPAAMLGTWGQGDASRRNAPARVVGPHLEAE